MADLEFEDLAPVEKTVRIGKRTYVLREPDTGAEATYRAATIRGASIVSENGKDRYMLGEINRAEPELVAACLWETFERGPRKRVTLEDVNKFRPEITKDLFEQLKLMKPSLFNKEDTDPKEQPESGASTSP